ncbi:MAG: metallopeptidase family protein [Mycobacteriales bacterium]
MRGTIAPAYVPIARSRSQRFDGKVLDAVEDLEAHSGRDLADLEFAVVDVPPVGAGENEAEFGPDMLADGGVPLSRILPSTGTGTDTTPPRIVLYRRPLEARAETDEDLDEVILEVVAEQVAAVLGIDREDLDQS